MGAFHPGVRPSEQRLIALAASRMGIAPRNVKPFYDPCTEVSTNPTYGSSTAASGSVSAVAAADIMGMRQCRTAAQNNSKAVLFSNVYGTFGDGAPGADRS